MAIEILKNNPPKRDQSHAKTFTDRSHEYFDKLKAKHEERLAYNAAYQRDLRKIKKLGLGFTVKEWREKNGK